MNNKTKRLIYEWCIILGMSSLGTFMAFMSWITQPENLDKIKKLIRM
jgi:hypothetical protein